MAYCKTNLNREIIVDAFSGRTKNLFAIIMPLFSTAIWRSTIVEAAQHPVRIQSGKSWRWLMHGLSPRCTPKHGYRDGEVNISLAKRRPLVHSILNFLLFLLFVRIWSGVKCSMIRVFWAIFLDHSQNFAYLKGFATVISAFFRLQTPNESWGT